MESGTAWKDQSSGAWKDETSFEVRLENKEQNAELKICGITREALGQVDTQPMKRVILKFNGNRKTKEGEVRKCSPMYDTSQEVARQMSKALQDLVGFNQPPGEIVTQRACFHWVGGQFQITLRLLPGGITFAGLRHEEDNWEFETKQTKEFVAFLQQAASF